MISFTIFCPSAIVVVNMASLKPRRLTAKPQNPCTKTKMLTCHCRGRRREKGSLQYSMLYAQRREWQRNPFKKRGPTLLSFLESQDWANEALLSEKGSQNYFENRLRACVQVRLRIEIEDPDVVVYSLGGGGVWKSQTCSL